MIHRSSVRRALGQPILTPQQETCPVKVKTRTAQIRVPGIKVMLALDPAQLPVDLVPADGPVGDTYLDLALEGTNLVARAKLNGKNYRNKTLKSITDNGAENVKVLLQAVLRPPATPNGLLVLDACGLSVTVKTSKPAEATAPAQNGQDAAQTA